MFSGVIFVTMNKPSSVMAQKKAWFPPVCSWHLPQSQGRTFCVCFNWKLIVRGVAMEIMPALRDTKLCHRCRHKSPPPSTNTFFCMRSRAAAGIVCPHWPCSPKPCEMRREKKKRERVKWETDRIKPENGYQVLKAKSSCLSREVKVRVWCSP